jgi:hypothetical protein
MYDNTNATGLSHPSGRNVQKSIPPGGMASAAVLCLILMGCGQGTMDDCGGCLSSQEQPVINCDQFPLPAGCIEEEPTENPTGAGFVGDWTGVSRQWHNDTELLDTRADTLRIQADGENLTLIGICGDVALHLVVANGLATRTGQQVVCPTRFTNGCLELVSTMSGLSVEHHSADDSIHAEWTLYLSGCGYLIETRVQFDTTERINTSADGGPLETE